MHAGQFQTAQQHNWHSSMLARGNMLVNCVRSNYVFSPGAENLHYVTRVCHKHSRCGGPRFGRAHIRQTHTSLARASAVPAFICSDVALVTYFTPGRSFRKMRTSHIGILGVLLMETMLETMENHCPLPSRSQVFAGSGPGRISARPNLGLQHQIPT